MLVCTGLVDPAEMTNMCITGPPGCGKTMVCSIIARVMQCVLFDNHGEVPVLCRADLVGEHLGETCNKTRRALDRCSGSCVFIDEVYSLGADKATGDKNDVFAKECIDTLTGYMTEKAGETMFIIGGYDEEVQSSFFAHNPGLDRRFPFRFRIEPSSAADLRTILQRQVKFEVPPWIEPLIEEHRKCCFKDGGGATLQLATRIRIQVARAKFEGKDAGDYGSACRKGLETFVSQCKCKEERTFWGLYT